MRRFRLRCRIPTRCVRPEHELCEPRADVAVASDHCADCVWPCGAVAWPHEDRKSTRLNSSHSQISYAVFCLKKLHSTTHSWVTFCSFVSGCQLFYGFSWRPRHLRL